MAPMSSEYGPFELLYELPMSAVSGGVGLGAGVGRGRGVVRPSAFLPASFAVTAPIARIRTANAALINFVSVFVCCFPSSFFSGIFWGEIPEKVLVLLVVPTF